MLHECTCRMSQTVTCWGTQVPQVKRSSPQMFPADAEGNHPTILKEQRPKTFVRISQTLSCWGTKRSYIFNSPGLICTASVLFNDTDLANNVGPTYCLARAQRPLTPFKPLSPKAKYSVDFKNPRLKLTNSQYYKIRLSCGSLQFTE